jgi:uncharacterized repeat protein (TIGR03806 family)
MQTSVRQSFKFKRTCSVIFLAFVLYSCDEDGLAPDENTIGFAPRISDYNIFTGDPSALMPSEGFEGYELSTELFSDYARKQRLIKLPSGTTMRALGEGLPEFPDSTILVKTFYYFNDARDTAKGRRILETRLIVKAQQKWNVATYVWNEEQNDAFLLTTGVNTTVNWIDEKGRGKVVSYHIPSNRECASCHHSSGSVLPIGPKLRNLNINVWRNSDLVNQLSYFASLDILDQIDPAQVETLPKWDDTSLDLEGRARAYLDVNCAHCHSKNGQATDSNLLLNYETPFSETRIQNRKGGIHKQMREGEMPQIGTTVVHEEAIELIRSYIETLN